MIVLRLLACIVLAANVGCSMCKNPYDCMYAAHGGSRGRVDMVHGRVGSRFASPGEEVAPNIAPGPTEASPEQPSDEHTLSSNEIVPVAPLLQ